MDARPQRDLLVSIPMKAKVTVRLKREVLDPEGDAIQKALVRMGHTRIKSVRVGKVFEIETDGSVGETLSADLRSALEKAAGELLANPVTEDFEIA